MSLNYSTVLQNIWHPVPTHQCIIWHPVPTHQHVIRHPVPTHQHVIRHLVPTHAFYLILKLCKVLRAQLVFYSFLTMTKQQYIMQSLSNKQKIRKMLRARCLNGVATTNIGILQKLSRCRGSVVAFPGMLCLCIIIQFLKFVAEIIF